MSSEPIHFKLHDTPDLLALLPYLLGYQPSGRLVVLVVADRRVQLTASLPLEEFDHLDLARASVDSIVRPFPEALVLLSAWTDDEALADRALGAAEAWVAPRGLIDSVVVGSRRWHTHDGPWPRRGGSTRALRQSPVAASAVLAGLGAASSRDECVSVVAGPAPDDEAALEPLFVLAADALDQAPPTEAEAVRQVTALRGRELTDQQVAQLALMGRDEDLRGALWLAIDSRHAEEHLDIWRQVVARTPARYALAPVLLMGCAAWAAGSGALLVACIERALRIDPDCGLAHLLSEVNRRALPPSVWEQLRAETVFGEPMAGTHLLAG